ncbi:tRNA lysidine(34) synthetase TilS [Pseudocolwellia sp. HL-MZ19]|uniref:tRNA lysidine(34) synthetase TilS n=1 Tax=Pseudocolwellia sp. HL-MZ19 TaxID=3400846 RepID=UPI003CF120FF
MSLESTLHNFLTSYPDSHLIIAYSGGIDSQVLLHALANIKKHSSDNAIHISNSVSVCHVNHGLSENAEQWEIFAKEQCDLRQFSLDICRVHINIKAQQSIEELARDARYDAIKALITEKKLSNVIVLTGHHSDDQAETFLLALKRGSGLKGLSAMKHTMVFGDALLARPLLNLSRSQIEAYAHDNGLSWIEDESNDDVRFDRNFIRHHVMPKITDRWPSFLKTINRSAEHCQEAESLLVELAQQDLHSIQTADKCLSLTKLQALSPARFNNLIRYFLSSHDGLMPSTAQLAQLQSQLFAKTDKTPAVKVGDYWLRRFKDNVYLTGELQDITEVILPIKLDELTLSSKTLIELPDGLGQLTFELQGLSNRINFAAHEQEQEHEQEGEDKNKASQGIVAPLINQTVSIRFSHNNPTCTPDYRQHSRSLKKILQELELPTWERKRLPFLYYNEELVAVIGYFVCKEYLPTETDNILSASWLK